jgi:hypothetical protein
MRINGHRKRLTVGNAGPIAIKPAPMDVFAPRSALGDRKTIDRRLRVRLLP